MPKSVRCSEREKRMAILMDVVQGGVIHKDTLADSAFELQGESQAMYYSSARKNLHTSITEYVMKSNQQLGDLKNLKHKER